MSCLANAQICHIDICSGASPTLGLSSRSQLPAVSRSVITPSPCLNSSSPGYVHGNCPDAILSPTDSKACQLLDLMLITVGARVFFQDLVQNPVKSFQILILGAAPPPLRDGLPRRRKN
ncbi:hypothetical protein FJTKL_11907 [Diaporthe vaccinii]|uniref:Uncharacterized protein n=1 Tax=Diaporthe vaccinii TaxID=105482 RepID=A0ABR4FAH0_9PEZI